ncbi:unnamed protein product, partial [Ilex paraguariensis]
HGLREVKLEVESDFQILVMMIKGKAEIPWKCRMLVNRICDLLGKVNVGITHIYREANGVTDFLLSLAVKTRCCNVFTLTGLLVEGKLLLLQDQIGLPIIRKKNSIILRSVLSQ